MTEKERMLMTIIDALRTCAMLPRMADDLVHLEYAGFGPARPQPGDIVISMSSGIHEWTASVFVEAIDEAWHEWLVRELGGTRTCRIGNDSLAILKGIRRHPYYGPMLLEGGQRQFYEKVKKAFKLGGSYWHQLDQVEFPDAHTARILVRVKWWASNRTYEENVRDNKNGYRPFVVEMPYTSKTPIKAILAELQTHGYDTEQVKEG